jgi:hypothetical protein
MKRDGRILQIIPADGWLAVMVGTDAASYIDPEADWQPTEEDVTTEAVACWALVEKQETTEVIGLFGSDGAALSDVYAYVGKELLGYAKETTFKPKDWVWWRVSEWLQRHRAWARQDTTG